MCSLLLYRYHPFSTLDRILEKVKQLRLPFRYFKKYPSASDIFLSLTFKKPFAPITTTVHNNPGWQSKHKIRNKKKIVFSRKSIYVSLCATKFHRSHPLSVPSQKSGALITSNWHSVNTRGSSGRRQAELFEATSARRTNGPTEPHWLTSHAHNHTTQVKMLQSAS